ncbi:MAG: aminotransferase class I/II-fold pyridoxal phosphate-dependent enzyme [Ruminococcaceae bacterium]|nr:aminotransferase class I/II-fold pyridoxal phosphate-dependent enzyme [Oscillospiraceae bacterium]
MTYDFTTLIDRHGRDALAIDGLGHGTCPGAPKEGFDAIPMWVADMNFATVPTIPAALAKRAQHPLYGYFFPTDEYYEAILTWQQMRNGVTGLKRDHIGHENGVLGGVVSALNALCCRGDKVLLHSPTYIGFTGSLENAGYRIVHSPLKKDEGGVWRMDFVDMEQKIIAHNIRAMVFCSPHNPTGRVWEGSELEQLIALCEKHDVYLVSDEIWSDIILSGRHIPTQSVSDAARQRTVALYAPSKTFNLAGLVGSYHIIYNDALRRRVRQEGALSHYNNMNVLSMHALIAGYSSEGAVWVDELRQVIGANVDFACGFLDTVEGITLSRPQGTYMLFLDCTDWCAKHDCTLDELLKRGWDVGVAWQDGRPFHGACHIRMNLALPTSRVREAFRRLETYVFCD